MLVVMRSHVFVASMCLTVAACQTWHVESGPSAISLAAADSTKTVRLTLASGAEIELVGPRVVGDSIVGRNRSTDQRVAFAVSDVRSVARQQVSVGRTALAAGGITTVVVLGALVVAMAVALASLGSF